MVVGHDETHEIESVKGLKFAIYSDWHYEYEEIEKLFEYLGIILIDK